MPNISVILTDEELSDLRERAKTVSLSMSDYLRGQLGHEPYRRPVGRRPVTAPCPVCGEQISAAAFVKHQKGHQA